MDDAQHPAFAKLFVQTELHPEKQAIICARRPRSPEEKPLYMFHAFAVHGTAPDAVSYETDRNRFIGRGRSLAYPAALAPDAPEPLSGTDGAVLDPIAAIRCRVTLDPGKSAIVDLFTGVGSDREHCLSLVSGYKDQHLADRIFSLAWTHSQVLLHQFNASVFDEHLYEDMAAPLIYGHGPSRADTAVLAANTRSQTSLWGQSISGDNPIALLKISGASHTASVTQMVKAHAYWRAKGLNADLVVLDESHVGYRQELLDLVISSSPSVGEVQLLDRPGGIYLRFADQIAREDLILLEASARLVFSDRNGPLDEQVTRTIAGNPLPAAFRKTSEPATAEQDNQQVQAYRKPALLLANRYGGFTPDGSEYVITLQEGEQLPAPWVNVFANKHLGTVISESGSAYTWRENAHEFRLTPWQNDPVQDESGEAIYIRDEESGEYWSPTPLPKRGTGSYCTRHGFGYSVFCHVEQGVRSELKVFVGREVPVKFSVLKVYNISGRERRLSATGYVEWVLGDLRAGTAQHIVTAKDTITGALLAKNVYSQDFPGKVAFFDVNQEERFFTADRTEFIGRNNSLRNPAAMSRVSLSGRHGLCGRRGLCERSGSLEADSRRPGRIGAGYDPCAALQVPFSLKDGESREIIFILGAADNVEQASALARRYTAPKSAHAEQRLVTEYWRDVLQTVQIKTPDPAVDVLANGWLMYQAMACRYLARSGYYQSSGAYGFRDQLQDCMAMVHAAPEFLQEQILRAASRQFPEGDVQHWWHPPLGRGVRTRCSDDLLWLPFAVERYIRTTGNMEILDKEVAYIEGRPLHEGEESYYDNPFTVQFSEPVYAHCVRALKHVGFGERGLPLMGSGDWNDGMDRVGIQGKGESVWLGFFLFRVLTDFIPLAEARGDEEFANHCRKQIDALRENLERHGWDGEWYRRAYFDDGTPLGSEQNEECRIDSVAQSWSVLSSAAPDWRQKKAMQSLYERLVRRDIGLVQLLDPPFDHSDLAPGYIKGYVPGVRENGGQYTHAAVWAAMAFAALGDTAKAWQLFRMINPVLHGEDMTLDTYKAEPYVVAADVYAVPPHEGRGGWTWYTGAAGWMYRLIVESLLGLNVEGNSLRITPLLPQDWEEVSLNYRRGKTKYRIQVRRAVHDERRGLILDGGMRKDLAVPLIDDGVEHEVLVLI
jgi:cellobiose phosphorylase